MYIGRLQWDIRNDELSWARHYAALLKYYEEYETCNIPKMRSYECDIADVDNNNEMYHYVGNLGNWLSKQREAKKGNGWKLYPERETKLHLLVDEGM